MSMTTITNSHLSSALTGAACTASAQGTWVNITAATFLAANGPAVGNDHSNSRPKQNGG